MRKSKRLLAFTLAALQILMLLPSTGMSAYAEEPEAVSESVESDESSGVLPADPVEDVGDSSDPVEDAGAALEPSGVLPADPAEDAGAIEQEGQSGSLPAESTESTGDPAKPVEDTEPSEVLSADPVENAEAIEGEGQAGVLPSDEPDVFYTLKVLDTYSDTGVSDVRYEESLPAGQGYSFSALEADGYVVDGATEFAGELTEDTTLEFLYIEEYTVTFYDIVAEEVISEVAVKAGEAAEAPEAPVYEGFKFIGWSEEFNSVSSDLTVETLYQALGVSLMSAGTELSNDYASAILYEDEKRLVVTGMFKSGTHRSNYPWYEKLSGYSVEFTDDVTFIGDYAFQSSGIIGELVIPNSVTSIGGGAFDWCSGLTGDLVIPDSVTSIGDYAFQACKGLTGDLIIPDSVTSIGYSAFSDCSGLTGDLVIPDSVTSIGDFAFEYCSGFSDTLILGNSLKTIGGGAFDFCNNITIIQGGENVTTVPDGCCFKTKETTPTIFNTSNEVLLNHDWAAENRVEKAKVLYTISFDSEGGTPVESISVGTNEYAKKPEDPTKPGYKFLGWMREGYGVFSFDSTTIWEDITLYAIWEEKPAYQIIFFSNGGTFVPDISVIEDEYAEKPEDPTRENYKFLGWKTSNAAEDYFNFETTPVTQNITLYAQWGVKDTLTVTFDTQGGSPVAPLELTKSYYSWDTEHSYGYAYIPEPEAPTKEGCEFRFWKRYNSKFDFESPVTSDITLYAEWFDPIITVTFDSNGGTPVASLELEKTYDSWDTEQLYGYVIIPEPEAPTKEGYELKYWSRDIGEYQSEFTFYTQVQSDITLYAVWYDPTETFTVTFDSNGGTPVDSQEVLINKNAVEPEAPVRDGYVFGFWTESPSSNYPFEFENNSILHDITLYARWYAPSEIFTVSFETNGGTSVDAQRVFQGKSATEPESPVRDGYLFLGWFEDESFSSSYYFGSPVYRDTVLYAKWVKSTCTVTFNTNGGTPVASQEVNSGNYVTEPEPPTRAGYEFLGWFLDESLSWSYFFGNSVYSDMTLYAKWEKTTFTVTFDTQGGTPVDPLELSKTYDSDDPNHEYGYARVPEPETPTKEGYVFGHWVYNDKYDELNKAFDFERDTVHGDATFYAVWYSNSRKVTVTFEANGGTPVDSQEVVFGTCVSKPEDPTRDGYLFNGWSFYKSEAYNRVSKYDFSSPVTSDITLYARWKESASESDIYTVTFDSMWGTLVDPVNIPGGKSIKSAGLVLPTTTRDGFIFAGWYTRPNPPMSVSNQFLFKSTTVVTDNITVYAVWKESDKYSIKVYDDFYDENFKLERSELRVDELYSQGSHYEFESLEDFPGYLHCTMIGVIGDYCTGYANEDIEIHFKYVKEAQIRECCTFLVPEPYLAEDGSLSRYIFAIQLAIPVVDNYWVTAPPAEAPIVPGYIFKYWGSQGSYDYKLLDGKLIPYQKGEKIDFDNYIFMKNRVFYGPIAVLEPIPVTEHTVTVVDEFYDIAGTTLLTSEVRSEKSYAEGGTYTVKALESEDYTLTGQSEYSGDVEGDVTITFTYTKVDQIPVTVTFDSKGGTSVDPQEVKPNGKVTEPADPVKDGFVFEYWYRDADGASVPFNFESTIITEDITLCALWIENSKFVVTVIDEYYDVDGTTLLSSETRSSEELLKDSSYSFEALSTIGYKVFGQSSYTGTVTEDLTVTFKYAEDVSVLGGTLVLSIPAEMELAYDASTGAYMKTDSVYASGRCGMKKRLDVQTPQHITFVNNDDDSVVIENAKVTFGSAVSDGSMQEQWSATELREGIGSPVGKSISVAVDKAAIDYLGSYSSLITYNVSLVENSND